MGACREGAPDPSPGQLAQLAVAPSAGLSRDATMPLPGPRRRCRPRDRVDQVEPSGTAAAASSARPTRVRSPRRSAPMGVRAAIAPPPRRYREGDGAHRRGPARRERRASRDRRRHGGIEDLFALASRLVARDGHGLTAWVHLVNSGAMRILPRAR